MVGRGEKMPDYTTQPICPYCGYETRDAWEIDFGSDMEGDAEINCGKCEKIFFVCRQVTVTYSTLQVKDTTLK